MAKGLRKFQYTFGATGLTRWGGLSLFAQFCKYLGLRRFLQLYVQWPLYHHRNYHPVDLLLAHIYALVAGIGRIENTQSLLHNGLIPPLLGLPTFPHRDTLRTFLWRFNNKTLRSLQTAHDKLRFDLAQRIGLQYSGIIDADTTSVITYGRQEGVAVGYVPKRRHRKASYAPLIASEGRTGLSLGMELRGGDIAGSVGAGIFLKHIFKKLPSTIAASRTRLRLDSGFYDKAIALPLDKEQIGYVIAARMTKPLKARMYQAHYKEFARGWEAASFPYTPFNWKTEHRFIAIRRPAALEPEEVKQHLFTIQNYTYHRVIVTNLDLTPPAVYRFYCDRAFQELLIREFKQSLGMAQIPTRSFWANNAYMEMILWAYDLVLAFQYLCLPPHKQHWNIRTLRRNLWWLPAELIRRDNRNLLKLPARYPQQNLFLNIQRTIEKVKSIL